MQPLSYKTSMGSRDISEKRLAHFTWSCSNMVTLSALCSSDFSSKIIYNTKIWVLTWQQTSQTYLKQTKGEEMLNIKHCLCVCATEQFHSWFFHIHLHLTAMSEPTFTHFLALPSGYCRNMTAIINYRGDHWYRWLRLPRNVRPRHVCISSGKSLYSSRKKTGDSLFLL